MPEVSHDQRPFRLPDSIRWKNGIIFDPEDPYNVKINHKGVRFSLDDDQDIKLMINFLLNGNIKANAQIPMLGGNLNIDASKTEGSRSIAGHLKAPLFGGELDAQLSRENGENRGMLQYRRSF